MPCPISIWEEYMVTVSSGEICRYPENGLGAAAPGVTSAKVEKPITRLEPAAAAPIRNERRDGAVSCAKNENALSFMLRPQHFGSFMDRSANAVVRVATADVTAHCIVDVLVGRFAIRAQQADCRHHLAGLAISTLRDIEFRPCRLNDLGDFPAGALNGDDASPINIRYSGLTGAGRLPIDVNRTGATECLTTTVFGADEPQIISQNPKQRLVGISVNLSRLTIERNAHRKSLPWLG